MFLKLGAHLLSRKTLSNILLMILIALSLFIANICIGIVNRQYSVIDSVKNFDKKNTYYYMSNIIENTDININTENFDGGGNKKNIKDIVSEAENDKNLDVGYIYYGSVTAYQKQLTSYSKHITYIGTDNKTSEKFNVGQLISGEWYTEAKHTDGCLNVVVVEGKYKVGDKFYLSINTNEVDSDGFMIFKDIKCIVTGLLKKGSYMCIPNAMANNADAGDIMLPVYPDVKNGELSVLYFSYEDEEVKPYLDYLELSNNCFIYCDDNADKNDIYNVVEKLDENGWTLKMQKIIDNTYDYMYSQIIRLVPFLFGVLLLTVVCLICIMTLNSADHLKTYSVYYLCGMNWSDMKKILLSYSVLMILGAGIIFAFISLLCIIGGRITDIVVFGFNNLFITLGIAALIIAVMVFVPYIILAKSSPKDALREN